MKSKKAATSTGAATGTGGQIEYTCPMHPEVRQGPGNCPKCGMVLEVAGSGRSETEYTCPMHPEMVRSRVVPHLRHGAGAAQVPREKKSRASGHDAAFLVSLALTCPSVDLAFRCCRAIR